MPPVDPTEIAQGGAVDDERLAAALKPLVAALLRVMVIELNQLRVERMPIRPMTEAERHVLERGHLLRAGCCRSSTQARAS